ncbi:MAG: hypothetical protein CML66_22995 [Rhodobacteraceae bacterium]|nr:hypothetical protein [Paracoccaceae bacterium]MAY46930.1 hypothetical protein [Paracoccaceae bacterium]
MGQFTIGDLSQSTLMRLQSTRMKTELLQLTQELATGVVTDVGAHLSGDIGYYADVEKNLRLLDGYDLAANEANQFADATQAVLGRIGDLLGSSIESALPATASSFQGVRQHASSDARNDLETVIDALNSTSVGRSLFAGVDTNGNAMISGDTFLATVKAALPAITDPASLATAVSDWFSDPAGFDAMAYAGSTTDLAPVVIGEDVTVQMAVRADDDRLKVVMEGLVLSVLATDSDYGFDELEQSAAFDNALTRMFSGQAMLTAMQADIGAAQERIETTRTRNAASRISLEQARVLLVGADAFETATRLDDVQVRLESLYAVTARMSRLSLVNYI